MVETLGSVTALDGWIAQDRPVWLLKHSTFCSLSAVVIRRYEAYADQHPDEPAAILVIQDHRDVSDAIAERFGIRHESPQIFLFEGGRPIWHASHTRITEHAMTEAMAAATGAPQN